MAGGEPKHHHRFMSGPFWDSFQDFWEVLTARHLLNSSDSAFFIIRLIVPKETLKGDVCKVKAPHLANHSHRYHCPDSTVPGIHCKTSSLLLSDKLCNSLRHLRTLEGREHKVDPTDCRLTLESLSMTTLKKTFQVAGQVR